MDLRLTDIVRSLLPPGICPQVAEEAYSEVQHHIECASAFERVTYQSIYIIDFFRLNFLHVSGNPLFLCGESVETMLQEGFNFYHKHVLAEDLDFLMQINKAGLDFFTRLDIPDRCKYTLSYNLHIFDNNPKVNILLNHQITPLKLDADGNIWLALCLVSLAPSRNARTARICSCNRKQMWYFSRKSKSWKPVDHVLLTENELAVIRMAHQGLSINEIALKINKSKDAVKYYRKNIFTKLNVSSISEAIAVATHLKLL